MDAAEALPEHQDVRSQPAGAVMSAVSGNPPTSTRGRLENGGSRVSVSTGKLELFPSCSRHMNRKLMFLPRQW